MAMSFEKAAFGFLGVLVAGTGFAAALVNPPTFHDRMSATAASVQGAPSFVVSPVVLPAGSGPARFDLNAVAAGAAVPRLAAWPPHEGTDVTPGQPPRLAFVERVLPLALLLNERVVAQRARLWEVRQRSSGGNLTGEDRLWLVTACDRYGVAENDFAELARRIDVVPASMLIAAAAWSTGWNAENETGWRSLMRAATAAGRAGANGEPAGGEALQPLHLPFEALRLYLRALNTHPDFGPLRRAREQLRQDGAPLEGSSLTAMLPRVSPARLPGSGALLNLIADQTLERFDLARLTPGGSRL